MLFKKIISQEAPSFFNQQKIDPHKVQVTFSETEIIDELNEKERKKIKTVIIADEEQFENLSSAEIDRFIKYLSSHYINVDTVKTANKVYNEQSLQLLSKQNSVLESLELSDIHRKTLTDFKRRINNNKEITYNEKTRLFNHVENLAKSSEDEITQFVDAISKMDERPHLQKDRVISIASPSTSILFGAWLFCKSIFVENPDAAGIGIGYSIGIAVLGTLVGIHHSFRYENKEIEDYYYSEKNKLRDLATVFSPSQGSKIYAVVRPALVHREGAIGTFWAASVVPYHCYNYERICGYSLGHKAKFYDSLEAAKAEFELAVDPVFNKKQGFNAASDKLQEAIIEMDHEQGKIINLCKLHTYQIPMEKIPKDDDTYKQIQLGEWKEKPITSIDVTSGAVDELNNQYKEQSKSLHEENASILAFS